MKQDDKTLTRTVAFFAATSLSLIALIYTFIVLPNIIFAVAGMGVLTVFTATMTIHSLLTFVKEQKKQANKDFIDALGNVCGSINENINAQTQVLKATYVYSKQAASSINTLEEHYTESQEALYKNLASIAGNQSKSAKLLIKYNQNNTNKLISTIKDVRNQLSDTIVTGLDQVQPNNSDVVNAISELTNYLKANMGNQDQALSMQLNNVAHELQNISSSIQHAQTVIPTMTVASVQERILSDSFDASKPAGSPDIKSGADAAPATPVASSPTVETPVAETPVNVEEPVAETPANVEEPVADTDISIEEALTSETIDEESVMEEALAMAEATVTESDEELNMDEVLAMAEAAVAETDEATIEEAVAELPAEEETTEAEETIEEKAEEEFTPTFTVVGGTDTEEAEPEPAADEAKTEEPEPVAEEAPKEEAAAPAVAPVSDDPNKQLSADEIAALFASAAPAPKKEEPKEETKPEPVAEAPKEEAAAPAVTPVSDDPNKQLSADEIAALFASAAPAPKKEEPKPEPPKVEPVSDDPNKQLSPDEIAALFASIG